MPKNELDVMSDDKYNPKDVGLPEKANSASSWGLIETLLEDASAL